MMNPTTILIQKLADGGSGTLVYILITLALLVISMFKGKKRSGTGNLPNKPQGSPPKSANNPPISGGGIFGTLLSSMANENFPNTAPDPKMVVDDEDFQFEETNKEETEIEPPSQEGLGAFTHDDPTTEIIETGLFEDLQTNQNSGDLTSDLSYSMQTPATKNYLNFFHTEFDARKAIIYAAIIDRKYF